MIKDHVRKILNSLQLFNLIKDSIYGLPSLPNIQMLLLITVVGVTSNYLSRRIIGINYRSNSKDTWFFIEIF